MVNTHEGRTVPGESLAITWDVKNDYPEITVEILELLLPRSLGLGVFEIRIK